MADGLSGASVSEHKWTKSLANIPFLSQAIIETWAKDFKISKRLLIKGYSNSVELYVRDVEVKKKDNGCLVKAKCFPSMRKTESPYSIMINLSPSVKNKITSTSCTCKAGTSTCSHIIGLLYLLVHYSNLQLKTVPPPMSKTSRPQMWHIPQRSNGLKPAAVDSLTVTKIIPPTMKKAPAKRKIMEKSKSKAMKRRNAEGVKSTLYCPVEQPLPVEPFLSSLADNLLVNSCKCQMLDILKTADTCETVQSNFGFVPKGCVLSYQQPLVSPSTSDIIYDNTYPTYPDFSLPVIEREYNAVLTCGELDIYQGSIISQSESKQLEEATRNQSDNAEWHKMRKQRLTSSNFHQACVRRKDHFLLAESLLNKKDIKTAAMKYGIEKEPEAAKAYASFSSNNIYRCGFVVNPSCYHLGTSPDRKVCDPTANPVYGLLEIKCPDKDFYIEVEYLKIGSGVYKLKKTHMYYYQVMGQMALTGSLWCDFFVWCRNDYHLERIFFDASTWHDMKTKLDIFYFNYYLPALALKS